MSNGSGVLRLNRFSYQNARMGFDPASLGIITLAATSAAAGAASASAQKKSAEATRQAADANAATLRNEADLQKQTGMENAKRMQQDAARQMGEARLDAAQSSLLREGSVPIREQALATRLQTRIQDEAAEAMRNAQSLYNRANMEQYMGRANARAQKTSAMGTLLSGFKQFPFGIKPPAVTCQFLIAADDAVTGHENGDGIGGVSGRYSPDSPRMMNAARQLCIGNGGTVRDVHQFLPD